MSFPKTETGGFPKTETEERAADERLVFTEWATVMAEVGWDADILRRRRLAVMRLLKHAKAVRRPVGVGLMREFIAQAEREGTLWPETREALR